MLAFSINWNTYLNFNSFFHYYSCSQTDSWCKCTLSFDCDGIQCVHPISSIFMRIFFRKSHTSAILQSICRLYSIYHNAQEGHATVHRYGQAKICFNQHALNNFLRQNAKIPVQPTLSQFVQGFSFSKTVPYRINGWPQLPEYEACEVSNAVHRPSHRIPADYQYIPLWDSIW